jgi:ribulose bisphosphate carboxylase small subunit
MTVRWRAKRTSNVLAWAALIVASWSDWSHAQALARVASVAVNASAADADAPALAAVDGKLGTWWAGQGLGTSLTLDLGSAKQVKQVRIAFHAGHERVYNFEIQASIDGQSFTSAGWFQSTGTARGFETFDVVAPGRYLRIVGAGNSIDRYNAYREVQVFASYSLRQLTPVAVSANPADPNAPAALAIDGNLNTEWAGAGVGSHLTLDWGATKTVQQVRIAFYNGNARVYGFQIQSSFDGQTYTSAGSFQSTGTTSLFESFSVTATGRYLRIVGWGNNINRNNSYYEVQAFAAAPTPGTGSSR